MVNSPIDGEISRRKVFVWKEFDVGLTGGTQFRNGWVPVAPVEPTVLLTRYVLGMKSVLEGAGERSSVAC